MPFSLNLKARFGSSIILVLLGLSFHLSLLSQNSNSKTSKPNYSLLWKIERNDLAKPSYLFGTMHLKDKRVFEFSDSVLVKLLSSDLLALELDFDTLNAQLIKNMFEKAEKRIFQTELFSDEELKEVEKKTSKFGLARKMFKNKSFRQIRDILDRMSPDEKETMPVFLDAYLYNFALNHQIKTIGLERVEEQLSLKDSIQDEETKANLKDLIDSLPKFLSLKAELVELYRSGDIQEIYRMYRKLNLSYEDILLDKRNVVMVDRMEGLLSKQSVFTAVGCAHLPGPNGIIELLRAKGYTLTKINASFSGISDSLLNEQMERITNWESYVDSSAGYSVDVPFKPQTYTMFGGALEMKMSQSFLQGPFYCFYSIPTAAILDYDQTFADMVKRLDGQGRKVLSQKKITYQGFQGIEIVFSDLSEENEALTKAFLGNGRLYLFLSGMSKEEYTSADAQRFFNSLQLFEPQKPSAERNWLTYAYDDAGVQLKFPVKPFYQDLEVPGEEAEEKTTTHFYTSMDLAKQEMYFFTWKDLPKGYYYSNDSLTFNRFFGGMFGEDFHFDPNSSKRFDLEQAYGYEPDTFKTEAGLEMKARFYLRGNRFYLLMAQHAIGASWENGDYFLNSIATTPYLRHDYKPFEIEGLEILLPSKPELTDSLSEVAHVNLENLGPNRSYGAVDLDNASTFSVKVTDLPSYYYIAPTDTFFKEMALFYKNAEDSIASGKPIQLGPKSKGQVFTIYPKQTRNQLQYITLVSGMKLFEIFWYATPEVLATHSFEQIISHLKITKEVEGTDVFQTKTIQLLNDLAQSDTAVFNKAYQATDYYRFAEASDATLLEQALFKSYPDSLEGLGRVEQRILGVLEQWKRKASLPSLEKLFNDKPSLRADILIALLSIDSTELSQALTWLERGIPGELYYFKAHSILDYFFSSKAFFENNINRIAQASLKNRELTWVFLDQINEQKDSLNLSKLDQKMLENKCLEWLQVGLDSLALSTDKEGIATYSYQAILASVLQYFGRLNRPDLDPFAEKIAARQYAELVDDIILYRLNRNLPIDSKMWKMGLSDPYNAWEMVKNIAALQKFDLIPEKNRSQRNMAQLALTNAFESDEIFFEKMTFEEERILNFNQKAMKVHLFSYAYIDEPKKRYWAFVGGIDVQANSLDLKNLIIYYGYEFSKNKDKTQVVYQQMIEDGKAFFESNEKK
jgi:uncharacterized protein YbaP (TraB family)